MRWARTLTIALLLCGAAHGADCKDASTWFSQILNGGDGYGLRYYGVRAHETATQLFLSAFVENHQNTLVRGSSPTGRFMVHLGRLLGRGTRASVYEGEAKGLMTLDSLVPKPKKFAFKFLHEPRFGLFLPLPRSGLHEEKRLYTAVTQQLPRFEAEPDFPKDPAWGKGKVPTLPTFGPYRTKVGTMLVKPMVKGMSVGALYQKYLPKTFEDLPEEVRQGLADYLKFVQIAHRVGSFGGSAGDGKLRIDLNPTNLVWVSDPQELHMLGMSRPGFTSYEFGEVPAALGIEHLTPQTYGSWVFDHMRSRNLGRILQTRPN